MPKIMKAAWLTVDKVIRIIRLTFWPTLYVGVQVSYLMSFAERRW